jgi:hypothetical protein
MLRKECHMLKKFSVIFSSLFVLCLIAGPVLADGPFGQAGKPNVAHLYLYEKNPSTWVIIQGGARGEMQYISAGPTFDFVFDGKKLNPGANYTLIYYPDPWPGTGLICLAAGTAKRGGNIHLAGSVELNSDLPIATDLNSPGAKIWLVLSGDVDCEGQEMVGWNPTEYLFENKLIQYEDTNLPEVADTVNIVTLPGNPATVGCSNRCISFYPEQPGDWGGEYPTGAVTAFLGDNDPAGYVILNANNFKPLSVNIRHLDGIADDSFDLFVLDGGGKWKEIGHYSDQGSTETWLVTTFSLLLDMNDKPIRLVGPNILIKFMPTGGRWSGFDTWGQLAISRVELVGQPLRPCHNGNDRD